jgi:DNA-binding IclR family transcriptional regulator
VQSGTANFGLGDNKEPNVIKPSAQALEADSTSPEVDDEDDAASGGRARGGIQALDAALVVLRGLTMFEGPVALTDLAKSVSMPTSKVHRYLASFIHAGLVTQTTRSGRYQLGSFAAEMGIAALGRLDFVNRAADEVADLSESTGLTVLLTVWGNQGATVIRWCRAPSPMVTSFGLGSTMPILTSASGRVFLAYLPREVTANLLGRELERARAADVSWPDLDLSDASVERLILSIQEQGYAAVDGRYVPGLRAVAAPILNWQGEAEAAVTLVSTSEGSFKRDSSIIQKLLEFTKALSSERQWGAIPR